MFHNSMHAADVAVNMCYILMCSNFKYNTTPIDLISLLISALAHDVGHPGVTNFFLMNSRDSLGYIYNDNSILENMHCSKLFSIM